MAQSKHEIRAILSAAGAEPRRRFGQNFMIDQNLVRIVAEAGDISANDWVIEVGPGTGTLTEELLSRSCHVVAVEIDRSLAQSLRDRYGAAPNFELIEGDALAGKHSLNPRLLDRIMSCCSQGAPVKLIANLPYQIASPLVIEMLIAGVELLVFTVQKEVAARLRAQPGCAEYGPLTIMAQLLSQVELLRSFPPQAFWPAPKIDSSLVRMRRADRLGVNAPLFGRFISKIFQSRRKTLRKAMAHADWPESSKGLERLAIDPQVRPENLSVGQFLALFDAMDSESPAAGSPPPRAA